MTIAPNTPGHEITRTGPYHNVTRGTVSSNSDHTPVRCRKCKKIPEYPETSHVVNGPRDSLRVFCEAHYQTCLAYKVSQ